MRTQTKAIQSALTPTTALQILRDGNTRFQSNLKVNRNLLEQVNNTADGQFPFAVVLSCIDSRTSAELIFDQGLGDIFSIRIAGNVLNDDILGSMEFACAIAGAKVVVVLGHSACGAVKGACSGASLGHLTGLLSKIQPAMALVGRAEGVSDAEYVDQVAKQNVVSIALEIPKRSPVLAAMVKEARIGIVGGMYSVQTGDVQFYDPILAGA